MTCGVVAPRAISSCDKFQSQNIKTTIGEHAHERCLGARVERVAFNDRPIANGSEICVTTNWKSDVEQIARKPIM